MESFLKYAEKKGCNYVELKEYSGNKTSIQLENDKIKELSKGNALMYAARVMYKNKEGLAYSNKEDYKQLKDNAIKLANKNSKIIKIDELPKLKKSIKTKFKINPENIDLEDKKKDVMKLDLRKDYKKINSLRVNYSDNNRKLKITTSEGRELTWNDNVVGIVSVAYAKDGNRLEQFYKSKIKHQGYELFKKEASGIVNNSMEMAEKMLQSKLAKGGNYPVIIDQALGGVFSHEAVGHGCEADNVLQGATVMNEKIGKLIASTSVNIIDDGSLEEGYGWTAFDDEGVEGQKTYLIRNGFLEGYLHTRETASLLKMKPTGNGRAESLGHRAIPRMTNTYFDNGDSNFKEMLEKIKDGYYLKGSSGGQVNPSSGEFLFNAQYGYRVENGELKELVKNVSLTGNILTTLKNISLVAKDLEFSQGVCGKDGQHAPVGDGAPHIKIDKARVGGQE